MVIRFLWGFHLQTSLRRGPVIPLNRTLALCFQPPKTLTISSLDQNFKLQALKGMLAWF